MQQSLCALLTDANGTFDLCFDENATTGYQWSCVYDMNKLQLVKDEYFPNPKNNKIGGGGLRRFAFKLLDLDNYQTITFNYCRAGDKEIATQIKYLVHSTKDSKGDSYGLINLSEDERNLAQIIKSLQLAEGALSTIV